VQLLGKIYALLMGSYTQLFNKPAWLLGFLKMMESGTIVSLMLLAFKQAISYAIYLQ
jgi:hypothetical protein